MWALWVRPAWVCAVMRDAGEAFASEASVGMGVGTSMGVQGVGKGGVVGVTASVVGNLLGVGMVVNGADMDVDGVGECNVGTGTGGVDGLGV